MSRVALVTGGASGMGEATCHELGRRGLKVAVLDVNKQAAQRVTEALRAKGITAIAVCADVTDRAAVEQAFAKVRYLIRARNLPELNRLIERVRKIADGAALMTETSVKATVVSAVVRGASGRAEGRRGRRRRRGAPRRGEASVMMMTRVAGHPFGRL